jgi:hypothetical protein
MARHRTGALSCVALIAKIVDAQYVVLLSDKVVLLQKKCDGCCVMGYRVRFPTHPLHIASSTASNCMRHDCLFLSHRIKYTSIRLSPIQTFPQCNDRISVSKTVHEMHIRIHVSESMHLCCGHCSCYRYYCPSLITALQQSALPGTLCTEAPLNNDNSKTDINVKTS